MKLRRKLIVPLLLAAVMGAIGVATALGEGTVVVGKPVTKSDGTAVLPITFTGPGSVEIWDAKTEQPCGPPPRIQRIQLADIQVNQEMRFRIKPTHLIKPALKQGKRVKVPVLIWFNPQGEGAPDVKVTQTVALHIKSKGTSAAIRRCSLPTPQYSAG